MPRAHAHNDYEHARPLLEALDCGFCSVEADIWLVDGELLVAHDRHRVDPKRTLQALYLEPLRARVARNGGSVYPGGARFTLLIDLKSEAEPTYFKLRRVLIGYTNMITRFTQSNTATNAVTVILSGNRPTAQVAAEPERFVAIDGRLPDLESNPSRHLIPLISDNWRSHFQWRGEGLFTELERRKLRQFVERAHQQGRRTRLWAIPDNQAAWAEMRQAGVDLINTDRLSELRDFLLGN